MTHWKDNIVGANSTAFSKFVCVFVCLLVFVVLFFFREISTTSPKRLNLEVTFKSLGVMRQAQHCTQNSYLDPSHLLSGATEFLMRKKLPGGLPESL